MSDSTHRGGNLGVDGVDGAAAVPVPHPPHRPVAWWARLVAVPAAATTLVLASCSSGGDAPTAAPLDGRTTAPAAAAPTAGTDPTATTPPVAAASPSASSPLPSTATPSPSGSPSRHARATPGQQHTAPPRASTPPRPASPRPRRSVAPPPPPAPSTSPPAAAAGGMTSAEAEVLRLVNVQRAANGCGPLRSDPVLLRVARAHSADMAAQGYFDHTGRDGRSPFDRMSDAGYRGNLRGENIAAGQPTPAAVMDAWMKSPGHRANILNCGYRVIGVGVQSRAGSPFQIYWTQDFGDR